VCLCIGMFVSLILFSSSVGSCFFQKVESVHDSKIGCIAKDSFPCFSDSAIRICFSWLAMVAPTLVQANSLYHIIIGICKNAPSIMRLSPLAPSYSSYPTSASIPLFLRR